MALAGVRAAVTATVIGHLTAPELVGLAGHWVTLWLALSLLSRRPRSKAGTLTAAALLVGSVYLLSVVFLLTPETGRADLFWDKALGNWTPFGPVLLLHAFLCLTSTRLPRQRLTLTLLYAAAAAVAVTGVWGTLLFAYRVPAGAGPGVKGVFVLGPLEFLQVLQVLGTLALALAVLVRAHRQAQAAVRSQLALLLAGSVLATLGVTLMLANLYYASLPFESLFQPLFVLGGLVVAVPLVRYRGQLEGQLLRSDLKASLLAAVLLMGLFLLVMTLVGASSERVAELGWLPLAVFLLGDELRGLAERAVFGAGQRAGRAGLRTAASYAGASETLDLASLSRGQAAELVEYLGALDRAGLATARLEGGPTWRLELLRREEFAPVRVALGLPATWQPAEGLSALAVTGSVAQRLEPRERQALGLKFLGYSDKEMARLMGVRVNVPRSYLSAAKRKLGLPAGAPLMLFVYLAGLVESDALPLLVIAPTAASPEPATPIPPRGPVEDLS